jgi:hypothetical protein
MGSGPSAIVVAIPVRGASHDQWLHYDPFIRPARQALAFIEQAIARE